jgi:sugar phosphate isomerase/epimerase
MKIGISTASLYPMYTEDALLELAKQGCKTTEIFLNSSFELEGEIFRVLDGIIKDYKMDVIALHPFTTPLETLYLFSSYERRVVEIMDLYKRHFEMMSKIGAKIFVIHGAYETAKCSDEKYCERLHALIEAGEQFGVTVAQENVSYCKSGRLEFLEMLAKNLGDNAKFVLDVKQARRSGLNPLAIAKSLKEKIVHLHLSDAVSGNNKRDCLCAGAGNFDFAEFFAELYKFGYKGGAVVELYRENFGEVGELSQSVAYLEKIEKNLKKT